MRCGVGDGARIINRLKSMALRDAIPVRGEQIAADHRHRRGARRIDLVVLVPWLKRGGADLAALLLVEGMLRLDPDAAVVVIATESGGSPWAARLPPSVEFIELGGKCGNARTHDCDATLL